MREMLAEFRFGAFACEWLAQVAAGKPVLTRLLQAGDADPIEIGRRRARGGENASSNPSPPAATSPERPVESK